MPPGIYTRTKPVWNKGLTQETDSRVNHSGNFKKENTPWNKGTKGIQPSPTLTHIIHLKEINSKRLRTNNPMFDRDSVNKMRQTNEKNGAYERMGKEASKRMSNGGAAYVASFNTNPSQPQLQLFNLTKSILFGVKLNYPCKNYSIDIAIPSQKTAIEYDGSYWHQDKDKDDKRQQDLEKEGWRFVRYRDYLPTKEELLRDITNL